jgi:hypothetical protein
VTEWKKTSIVRAQLQLHTYVSTYRYPRVRSLLHLVPHFRNRTLYSAQEGWTNLTSAVAKSTDEGGMLGSVARFTATCLLTTKSASRGKALCMGASSCPTRFVTQKFPGNSPFPRSVIELFNFGGRFWGRFWGATLLAETTSPTVQSAQRSGALQPTSNKPIGWNSRGLHPRCAEIFSPEGFPPASGL